MSGVGYLVRGVLGSDFEAAKLEAKTRFELREKLRSEAEEAGQKMPRKIKLKDIQVEKMYHRIIFGPTVIESSANDAVDLARRSGFLDVRVDRAENE
jgi:hypothetical protein